MQIPSLSERTLRRDIAKAEISTGPEIQVRSRYINTEKYLSHFGSLFKTSDPYLEESS